MLLFGDTCSRDIQGVDVKGESEGKNENKIEGGYEGEGFVLI